MDDLGSEKRPVDISHYIEVIAKAFPDFKASEVRLVHEVGQYNDALVVDEAFIFRFPRYRAGIDMMQREVAFLTAARGRTTLPVPEPIYAQLDVAEPGEIFMGYRLLTGEPMWREAILNKKDEKVLDVWAQQLAGFLQELHSLSVREFEGNWPQADGIGEWKEMYYDIRADLLPLMRTDARRAVVEHFDSYLNDSAMRNFQPAPRHGDYGSGNILYDPETKMITAIIDFGFAAVGDPAIDIAAVSTLGAPLFGRFADIYPAVESMLPRAHFYRGTYALSEALFGLKNGDRGAFEAGMAQYV